MVRIFHGLKFLEIQFQKRPRSVWSLNMYGEWRFCVKVPEFSSKIQKCTINMHRNEGVNGLVRQMATKKCAKMHYGSGVRSVFTSQMSHTRTHKWFGTR